MPEWLDNKRFAASERFGVNLGINPLLPAPEWQLVRHRLLHGTVFGNLGYSQKRRLKCSGKCFSFTNRKVLFH